MYVCVYPSFTHCHEAVFFYMPCTMWSSCLVVGWQVQCKMVRCPLPYMGSDQPGAPPNPNAPPTGKRPCSGIRNVPNSFRGLAEIVSMLRARDIGRFIWRRTVCLCVAIVDVCLSVCLFACLGVLSLQNPGLGNTYLKYIFLRDMHLLGGIFSRIRIGMVLPFLFFSDPTGIPPFVFFSNTFFQSLRPMVKRT